MNKNQYFIINEQKHKVIGIKNDRVIFQNMEKNVYTTYPSYKIHYNVSDGYYVNVPSGHGYTPINLKDILKEWTLFQEIYMYYRNK